MSDMTVHADIDTCECYANCVTTAPELFAIVDGRVAVLVPRPREEHHDIAREAVESCPVEALWIETP